jgi:hypothetical protein
MTTKMTDDNPYFNTHDNSVNHSADDSNNNADDNPRGNPDDNPDVTQTTFRNPAIKSKKME